MSDSLRPHGLQHARFLCPPLTPRVCSDLCPLSWWYYLTISSSVASLLFFLQPFPASGSFSMSWLFVSGGQSIEASAAVLPMNSQGWFPLGLTSLIFLQSRGFLRVNPKGNQLWILIGRTDAEAEAPILWPPDAKANSLEKTLMLRKTEGQGKEGDRGWDG